MSAIDLTGISETNCAAGCSADACVISGRSYCAHPCKAGLMFDDRTNPDTHRRYTDARRKLGLSIQKEAI